MVKSRGYLALLVFGAIIGVPVAVIAYFFLKAVTEGQQYFFVTLPKDLGFHAAPLWWPLPMLALGGLLVGLTIRHLPGTGGHNPAEGLKPAGTVNAIDLPGIFIAALATLCFGAVLGPEAPLVLIGAGIAVLIVHLIKRDAPEQAIMVIGAAGSFAAIATLLISPLAGAFLLLEAAGIGGGAASVVLAPGLLAAGIGALIFVGLNNLTGFGIFSLAVPHIPAAGTPTVGEFAWAIGIGLAAAMAGTHPPDGLPGAAVHQGPRGAPDPGGRPGHRRPGHTVRRGNGQGRRTGPVLRTVGSCPLHPARRHLVGGRSGPACDLQGPGLLSLAEQLP